MNNLLFIQSSIFDNRGIGFLVFLVSIIFILIFDKIVKLIIKFIDKIEERKIKKKD